MNKKKNSINSRKNNQVNKKLHGRDWREKTKGGNDIIFYIKRTLSATMSQRIRNKSEMQLFY